MSKCLYPVAVRLDFDTAFCVNSQIAVFFPPLTQSFWEKGVGKPAFFKKGFSRKVYSKYTPNPLLQILGKGCGENTFCKKGLPRKKTKKIRRNYDAI